MSQLNSKLEDEQTIVIQLQKKIKELQVIFFVFTSSVFLTYDTVVVTMSSGLGAGLPNSSCG